MKVDFKRLTWENYPSTETPINADNLNRLEEGVAGLYSDLRDIEQELEGGVGEYVSDWLSEHVDPVGSAVVVDDTLSIEGAAADAKKTGDELTSLKEDIGDLSVGEYPIHLILNKYINAQNGNEQTYNGWSATDFIPISTVLKVVSPTSMSYCALYNSSKEWVAKPIVRQGDNYYTPEDGAYIRLSETNANMSSLKAYTISPFDVEYINDEFDKVLGYRYTTTYDFRNGTYVNLPGCKIDDISIAMNGALMDYDALQTRLRFTSDKYSHDATIVDNGDGYLYCVSTVSDNINHDSPGWSDAYVELSKTAKNWGAFSSSQHVDIIQVAKIGDTVGNKTITSGCGVPNMAKLNSTTLRIIFSAKLSDDKWYVLYRDYNTSNGTFGSVGVCQLNNMPFTSEYLMSIVSAQGTPSFVSVNAQIAEMSGVYYIGVCIGNILKNGVILTSSDLISFDFWLEPEIDNSDGLYEAACFVKEGALYYALRQYTSAIEESKRQMKLCKIRISDKTILDSTTVYDAGSRPYWIEISDTLYLLHSISNRDRLEFIKINTKLLGSSSIVCHGGIFQCSYPTLVTDENGYWICGTSNGFTQVYLRKFRNFNTYTVKDSHSLLVGLLRLNS